MPQLIFTFTINSETQEATFAGNVEPRVALQVLQQIVIDHAISEAKDEIVESQKHKTEESKDVLKGD